MNKKIMLWACVTLLPFFTENVAGQSNNGFGIHLAEPHRFEDTLVIKLAGTSKAVITGLSLRELKELGDYTERLKTLFINDFTQAINNKQLSIDAEEVHYFVANESKRRIKAEAAEYTQNRVDVEFETNRLLLDLPKFHYAIHDIPHKLNVDIFVSNPDSLLIQLGGVSFTEAITKATETKKLMRQYSKMEISTDSNQYRISNKPNGRADLIEFSPIVGVGLIGNSWSPLTGAQLVLRFNNKYQVPFLKLGFELTGFALTEFSKGELVHLTVLNSYNGRVMFNLSSSAKNKSNWVGLQGGYISSPGNKTFNNGYKFGFAFDAGGTFTYSFDYIRFNGQENDPLLGFSIIMPF